jgi:hypothetical protein
MAWKKILFSGSSGELSSLAVDGNITGVFQGALSSSAQIADDISGSISAAAIVNLGAGILSGSQHEGMNLSGSFSGSYIGNGSGLTNLDVAQVATIKNDFTNQTSVNVDHNFDSRNVNVAVYNDSNVQILPASVTLSTVNRAVVTFDSSTSGYIVVSKGGHLVSGSVSADNISGLDTKLVNLGFASTGSNTFTGNNIFTTVSGSGFSGSFQGDGSGLTGVTADGTLSSSAQIADEISGSGNVRFEALNAATSSYATKLGLGIISASVLSSPSQGTVRLATNGVNTDVDTGLQAGDSPTFTNLTLTGDLEVQGTTTTIDSTTLDIGDNIIALNGTGAALGGLHVNDANGPASGSILWDGTNNKWIAGASGSEVTVALLEGQGLVSGSASQVRTFLNVEDGADVTDATNVTAAGALMDSEVASLALIKALTAAQISGSGDVRFEALNAATSSYALGATSLTAGNGLTGGGDLSTGRTFNVASANNGIVANADNIELATASSTFTDGVKAKLSAEGVISSSAQIDGDFLNTTGDDVLSGSAQIAVEISGSFVSASNALQGQIDSITTSFTLSADSGTNDTFNSGETLTFTGDNSITTTVSNNEITISIANDVVSGSAQLAADISGSGNVRFEALNAATSSYATKLGLGIVSASVLSSPSQGTARLAINGVNTDVDLGLQAGDSPAFTNLTVNGDLTVTGNTFEAQVTNLNVEDRMILLNSGSTSGDVGIIFGGSDPAGDGTNNANTGSGIFWDSPTNVFGFAQDVITSAVSASVQSKIGNIETSNSNPSATPVFQGTGTTHVNESDESIWIYS